MSLFLFGKGEHARVVAEAAAVVRCLDRDDEAGLPGLLRLHPDAAFHLAFGDNRLRRMASARLALPWRTVIHPRAWVSPSARIGDGVFIGANAVVQAGAVLGDHVIVNTAAVVEHDCRVGSWAHIAPGAVLGGGVTVGEAALIGLGARVRDHRQVGADAIVGMGAVAIDDVAAETVVVGVPARVKA